LKLRLNYAADHVDGRVVAFAVAAAAAAADDDAKIWFSSGVGFVAVAGDGAIVVDDDDSTVDPDHEPVSQLNSVEKRLHNPN